MSRLNTSTFLLTKLDIAGKQVGFQQPVIKTMISD